MPWLLICSESNKLNILRNWNTKSCDRSFLATCNLVWGAVLLYSVWVTQPDGCWSTELNRSSSVLCYGTVLLGTWTLNQHFYFTWYHFLFTSLLQSKVCATICDLVLNKVIAVQEHTKQAREWLFNSEKILTALWVNFWVYYVF